MNLRHGETKLHTLMTFISVSATNNFEIIPHHHVQPDEQQYLLHAVKSEETPGTDHVN